MKKIAFVLLALLLGVGAGIGVAVLQAGMSAWTPPPLVSEPVREEKPVVAATGPAPKVKVDDREYDVGMVLGFAEGVHDFKVTNPGDAPLTLQPSDATGLCSIKKIGKEKLAPGESTTVAVAWKCDGSINALPQTATLATNDPTQPSLTLTISGTVRMALAPSQLEMVAKYAPSGETTTVTAPIYCRLEEPLKVTGETFSNADTAKFFQVASAPLSAEALKNDTLAKNGVLLKVTIKPGLPSGAFEQGLTLRTNLKAPADYKVLVRGFIGSDVRIMGPHWRASVDNADQGLLNLDTVSGRTGFKEELILKVRGPHRKDVTFKTAAVTPSVLKVQVGKPREVDHGEAVETPLVVEIPPGSPPVLHLGGTHGSYGEINLETTHPQVPNICIRVRFAIGN